MAFISHRRVRRLGEDCDLSRPPPVIKIIARKFSLFSALLSNQLFSFFLSFSRSVLPPSRVVRTLLRHPLAAARDARKTRVAYARCRMIIIFAKGFIIKRGTRQQRYYIIQVL